MRNTTILIWLFLANFTATAQVKSGQAAPEITLPNMADSLVNLSAFKGKVVLLDFWASWCGPCRAANPSNVKLYKAYGANGFTILGVSIDQNKAAWLKAVQKDGLIYPQLNDNRGWNSPIAETYGVDAIPTTFLIDKTGRLRARDLTGLALKKMIAKLLKE